MAHLRPQFAEALKAIEPGEDRDNAPVAHQQVRDALKADSKLADYGIDPVLIGSYKRHVSIRRVKDVDVFARMPNVPADMTADKILDRFFTVLHNEFGRDADGHRRTTRQDRSLKVNFPEYDLYVDAVPARPHGDGTWEIPQKKKNDSDEGDPWVRTNPEAMTTLSSQMNNNHNEFYVPTVKLLRQTRRALLGTAKPGGFFIESVVYEAFRRGSASGSDQAEYYVSTLAATADIVTNFVKYGIDIPDPTLPGNTIKVRVTQEELDRLESVIRAASQAADRALQQEDLGKSAVAFRELLGVNGDGDIVFPVPPGYDEDGTKRASTITPGAKVVPAGRRTFG
jgi:hypothetical protein